MSEISTAEVVQEVSKLFVESKYEQALEFVRQHVSAHIVPQPDTRRLLTVQASLLCELGRWQEARRHVEKAQIIAATLNDPVATMSCLVNIANVCQQEWDYAEVMRITRPFVDADDSDSPVIRDMQAGLQLLRAFASLALRRGSDALPAASQALKILQLPDALINSLYFAQAVNCSVRAHLLASDLKGARSIISLSRKMQFSDRGKILVRLARVAIAAEEGSLREARQKLTSMLKSEKFSPLLRRDAFAVLLRVEQKSGNAEGVLSVLEQIAQIVATHRTTQMHAHVHMGAETSTGLLNMPPATTHARAPQELMKKMDAVLSASEPIHRSRLRALRADLAEQFALHLGYGTVFATEIRNGSIASEIGAFTHVVSSEIGPMKMSIQRLHIQTTLGVLSSLGFSADRVEYRVAQQCHERLDGDGPLRFKGPSISREAQVVKLAHRFVMHIERAELSPKALRDFIAQTVTESGRDLPSALVAEFAVFVERADSVRLMDSFVADGACANTHTEQSAPGSVSKGSADDA